MYALLKRSGRGLAAVGAFALLLSAVPATASIETSEAKAEANAQRAAAKARPAADAAGEPDTQAAESTEDQA